VGCVLPEEANMGVKLRSWTSIAAFISCGVRTAQRYERELGLPVHRDRDGGEVWADGDELLNWVRGFKAPNRFPATKNVNDAPARTGGRRK
jgi:hypothetical protein